MQSCNYLQKLSFSVENRTYFLLYYQNGTRRDIWQLLKLFKQSCCKVVRANSAHVCSRSTTLIAEVVYRRNKTVKYSINPFPQTEMMFLSRKRGCLHIQLQPGSCSFPRAHVQTLINVPGIRRGSPAFHLPLLTPICTH